MRDIWRLQHFLGVVEASSIHGAARNLNISQPAMTKSIRLLEEALDTELLVRLPRGVRLTEAGEALYARAREIEASWNAAIVEIGAQSSGMGGVMRLGGGPVYCSIHFPGMLADLRRRFPNLRIQVSTGVGNELLPELARGDIRAYAGGMPEEVHELGSDFLTEELYRQRNAVFASRDHPLFRNETVTLEDTLTYPWLCLFSGQQANLRIRDYFRARGLPEPRLALESHSLQIAFKMIAEHRFLACMPTPLAGSDAGIDLAEVEMDGFSWSIPTGVTMHRRSAEFGPIRQMIRSLRSATEALRTG
ncbi:LysR family transcriptional regulator [Psychromarinibacter sp. C21-152]|uniref:LysR family transcriptional regulator n=1 Tax=Psychromarinibacter sediminicola TaxID=3033385 RepID=A0AAE3NS89_9RHOB|nr:LysR family transcriptional regulator [Psychromarinibacter sediminicola]MDF0600000.1 LysR family transcriptional regulator [Psychromarinibacter sediminicola]